MFKNSPILFADGKYYWQMYHEKVAVPGHYIDEEGNVFSSSRGFKKLKLNYNKVKTRRHYPELHFYNMGKKYSVSVHRVVCESVHGYHDIVCPVGVPEEDFANSPLSMQEYSNVAYWNVDHINENKLDFRPENLRWLPAHENRQAYADNLRASKQKNNVPTKNNKNGRPRLYNEEQIKQWKVGLQNKIMTVAQICEANSISKTTLYRYIK